MIRVTIVKNTHNRSQHRRWRALLALVNVMQWEDMPSDSGWNESQVRSLFGTHRMYSGAEFANVVTKVIGGDVFTSGKITVDPALLTVEQVERAEWLVSSGALKRWFKAKPYGLAATSIPAVGGDDDQFVWQVGC